MEMKIKKSEERILRYLGQVSMELKYLRKISTTLDMDYAYLLGIIEGLKEKGWIRTEKHRRKTFCELTSEAPKFEEETEHERM